MSDYHLWTIRIQTIVCVARTGETTGLAWTIQYYSDCGSPPEPNRPPLSRDLAGSRGISRDLGSRGS